MLRLAFQVSGRRIDSSLLPRICEGLDRALVVRPVTLRDERGRSVALEVGNRVEWSVNRQLLIVRAKTMAVCVGVREETRLQDGIGGRFDVGDEMRWCECNLAMYMMSAITDLLADGGNSPARSRRSNFWGSRREQVSQWAEGGTRRVARLW
jgi:hypothetical protein